ncbi:MAG: 4-hydroxy-tetrahydrodipicolinate reductase [Chloroflexi bacterium]|nr:4-hydroxy-tetrahydrodipicolinate reductase [Chloroflexota bacterium]
METIKIVIQGALGKMGQEVASTVCREAGMKAVGAVDKSALKDSSYDLPDGSGAIPLSNSLEDVVGDAQVVVDFSNAEGAMTAMRVAAAHKVNVVIGSTGLTDANLQEAESLANEHKVGIIVAPNFAMGAVLMIHLAKMASRFFDYADLTEVHHEAKIDAPS